MTELTFIAQLGIYAMMFVVLAAAVAAVTLRNLFHCALALAGVLIGVAGMYLAMHAEFLAMVQILIYVGAVMTLIIFAIMLTQRLGAGDVAQNNKQSLFGAVAAAGFVVTLGGILWKTPWPVKEEAVTSSFSASDLGESLMTTYVLPFEIIAIVLFAVLIGAIVVARKDAPKGAEQ
ncbi:MAG: NADH-quinone oxidoreductase subunit J [Candidatus Omnitrophota bacterium]|nr:NADH-quinone oxidoreductase subunit J [Candidatus Omnitrophota bacterium]